MTTEEKELLLKDLCGRLRYGIIASVRGSDEEFRHFHILGVKDDKVWVENDILQVDDFDDVEVVKPYLRPMSSMTEEEREEFQEYVFDSDEIGNIVMLDASDWLNTHYFDHRGLIPMGLALEALEGMYNN